MPIKKSVFFFSMLLTGFGLLFGEVFTWQANTGKQYETTRTVSEYVLSLSARTAKPAVTTENTVLQETTAVRQSTNPNISFIPSFPKDSIETGARWSAPATVSYDLRNFKMTETLTLNPVVQYQLLGREEIDGRFYYHIVAIWHPILVFPAELQRATGITRLSGYSRMDIYWDNVAGSPKKSYLTEELQYRFQDDSALMTRRITDELFKTVTDITRQQDLIAINKQIENANVDDIEIKQADEGIVISMENIQFQPDSDILATTEKDKLAKIGGILKAFQDRRIKIIGHAADPGGSDPVELLTLSRARAASVAEFMILAGIRDRSDVLIEGLGATVPLGDNSTAEGRAKNRRVEIIILDKGEE